jgi:hypothetical protein
MPPIIYISGRHIAGSKVTPPTEELSTPLKAMYTMRSTEEALWESKEEQRVVHYNQGELVPCADEDEDNDKSFNQFNQQQGPNARSATGLSKDMTAPGSLQSP